MLCALLMACSAPPGARDAAPEADAGCAPGRTRCGSQCVDLTSNVNHCGACSNRCPDGPAGSPICDNGCAFDCVAGRFDCDPSVPGCEEDLVSPSACGSCGHVCVGDDTCDAPDCMGDRQVVANSTFAVDLANWSVANNPVNAEDTVSTFRWNTNNDAENEPSTGPCARVLYQDVFVRADLAGATFSAEVRSNNSQPLMPDAVLTIETKPNDGVSDAFRIDLVDPDEDVFYAPILFPLFANVNPVGTQATPHVVSVASPALLEFLRSREGTFVRVRVAQVESNVPWHVDVDNVSLTLNIVY